MNTLSEKQCSECKKTLPVSHFYRYKKNDRPYAKCKACVSSERKSPEAREAARLVERRRDSKPENRKKSAEKLRKQRAKNPEKTRAEYTLGNFLRKHEKARPTYSTISEKEGDKGILRGDIYLYQPDYSKPLDVIPCRPYEHLQLLCGEIQVLPEYIVNLENLERQRKEKDKHFAYVLCSPSMMNLDCIRPLEVSKILSDKYDRPYMIAKYESFEELDEKTSDFFERNKQNYDISVWYQPVCNSSIPVETYHKGVLRKMGLFRYIFDTTNISTEKNIAMAIKIYSDYEDKTPIEFWNSLRSL